VWNGAGDCGVSFQKGETYLVYATDDEETDRMETSVCHRTARLSDSGEDLAYLDFFRNGGQAAGRLEGFVTSEIEELHPDQFRYTGRIQSPVSDVIIELKATEGSRYTEPDSGGRFVFDGLAEGDYLVSVFELGFPDRIQLLSAEKKVRVKVRGCSITTFLVLVRELGH